MKHSYGNYTSPFASGRLPLIILSLILLTDFSCSERPGETTNRDSEDSIAGNANSSARNGHASTQQCYLNTLNKDTTVLRLTIANNQVSGSLEYKRYEKDQNKGTIDGTISGDTILADYTFASEGMQSVREVMFLKRDNMLIEGYGEIEEKAGKTIFSNRAALRFNEKMALREVPCE